MWNTKQEERKNEGLEIDPLNVHFVHQLMILNTLKNVQTI